MEKIKVIQKVKFGAGFDALGLSLAGAIAVGSLIELYKLSQRIENDKAVKNARKAIDILSEYAEKVKETEENKEGEEESQ